MPSDRSELPPGVIFQLQTLNDVNEKIEKLEAELSKAREEREHLKAQITKYRASVAPIRRIPSEILTMIFEEYVKDQPTHIRRLLLVCHLWYHLGMGTPRLWTYIELKLGSVDSTACTTAVKYAKACHSRSKNGLLHIVRDFRSFPNPYEYIDDRIGIPFRELTANSEDWHDILPDFESLAYTKLISKYAKAVKFMVSQIQRWQSLRIAFRSASETEDLFQKIWPLFSRKAPKLVELVINGAHISDSQRELAAFFSTSPLTSLNISDCRIFASIASFKPPLKTLVCRLEELDTFKHIHPFTGLQRLTLICSRQKPATDFDPGKLCLPSLRYLSLQGSVPGKIIRSLDTPGVQDLHIRRDFHQEFDGLPNVSPVNVVWEVERDILFPRKPPASTEDIRTLFEKYPGMLTLVMYQYHKRHALALLADIREKDLGLKCLRSITFIRDEEYYRWREMDDGPGTESATVDTCFGRTRDELLASVDDVSDVTSSIISDDDSSNGRDVFLSPPRGVATSEEDSDDSN